jgi:MFS family permease
VDPLQRQAAGRGRRIRQEGWQELVSAGRLPRFALVCVGTWLTAAETLMTATVMPSVARDIGGYAWFGWVVAIYMIGAIVAGATAGVLAQRIGLRRALMFGAMVYTLGCAASAAAPVIGLFLAGRLLQGIGGGWVVGLSYVAVNSLFPQTLWSRVLSAMAGVWGAATLVSPLIGGLFAQAGFWRGAFWLFALQGLGFIAASHQLIAQDDAPARAGPVKGLAAPLAVLSAGIIAIATAGQTSIPAVSAVLGVGGCGLVALFLRLNARSAAPLLPRSAANPISGVGAGLLMIFALQAACIPMDAYGPAILQALHGASPVLAGYILGAGALAWTVAALAVASSRADARYIRLGTVLVLASLVGLPLAMPRGTLAEVTVLVVLMGGGFGLAWSFTSARIVASAPEPEQAIASSAVPTAQMIGTAFGAAAGGTVANLLGFGAGVTAARAASQSAWLFAALIPLALPGALAAWRVSAPRFAPK